VLGLGEQIERQRGRIGLAGGDHEQVTRAGETVDANLTGYLALGLLHVQVSGSHDHVDGGDGPGPVGERRDRVRAAHPVDRVHSGEPAGREHHRIEVSVLSRRRTDGDVSDPGESRGNRAHHHGARVRGPSAGNVDRGAVDGRVALDHAVLAELGHGRRAGQAGTRHRRDVLDRPLDPVADRRVELRESVVELASRDEQRLRLTSPGVERPGVVAHGPVTAGADGGDDQRHAVADGLRRRHELAYLGRHVRGVVAR
jgi:hypothetical protein